MIEFVGIVESFRKNKISEDGGGLRFVVDMPETQKEQWKALSDWNGKVVKFTVTLEAQA